MDKALDLSTLTLEQQEYVGDLLHLANPKSQGKERFLESLEHESSATWFGDILRKILKTCPDLMNYHQLTDLLRDVRIRVFQATNGKIDLEDGGSH